jgi:hypothetical protein
MVQMDVEQGGARILDGTAQGGLHALEVVEMARAEEVEDQMGSGETDAVALDEVIEATVLAGELSVICPGSRVVRDEVDSSREGSVCAHSHLLSLRLAFCLAASRQECAASSGLHKASAG